ncbi:MAG TPA: hypothetical protein VF896_14210 [Anaerolineales bacterium]
MIQPTLLFGALLSALSAGIYYYVGHVLSRRHSSIPDSHLAWRLFVVWWYALAASTLSGAGLSLLGALGMAGLPLFTTFTLVNVLAICVGLYGLVFYLLYLFTGSRRILGPLTLFYIAYYILLLYYVQASDPIGVTVERWRATLVYQNQLRGPIFQLALLLLLFPPILGGLAYFMLYFQVKSTTQKYRILLVSWSIIIWFLSAYLANISGLAQYDWWQIASRLISLAASLAIMLAYQPPLWIKRYFSVTSIAEEIS